MSLHFNNRNNDDINWIEVMGKMKKFIPMILGFILLINSYYVVPPSYTALHIRMGEIIATHKESGLYWKVGFVDNIVLINNGIQKTSIETTGLSKDLQAISIGIDINYRYINELELYKTTLNKAEQIIIIPFCHESIKSILARYTAEELIQHRHEAKESIYNDLKNRLKPQNIEFIEVNFSHADFSHEFIKSVEDKQIALQRSMMAKNITETVRENALQQRLVADAEAYAQQVKKSSVTKELSQLKAIEKWDGVLPRVVTGTIPFLSLDGE